MNPIIEIIDNLFADGKDVRAQILAGAFGDVTSPIDQIVYPAINAEVPEAITVRLHSALSAVMGYAIQANHTFARAMYAGTIAPNQAHSDISMGAYAAHLYLSLDCSMGSGTMFLNHVTQGPVHSADTDVAMVDTNSSTQWEPIVSVQAKFNRLLVHRAECWHIAMPTEGWGDCPENARLVLTCFFD